MKKLLFFFLILSSIANAQKSKTAFADELQPAVFSLSMIMMHDVVNPPAASRYYAYCTLGAYEIVAQNNATVPSLSSFVKSYIPITISEEKNSYDYRIAALYCIYETGRLMLPSGFMLEDEEKKFLEALKKKKIDEKTIQQSVAVANAVAARVVAYSKTDEYSKLSAKLHYTPVKGDGYWYPTPPSYMEAVEPNWKTVRPMIIDSCNQFVPHPPAPFSKDSSSAFYAMAKEIYNISKAPTKEQLTIASFWDCNPFIVATSGHMAIGFKKISPGGHWMNITSIAAKKANLDFDHTIMLHTIEALTLMDAFISCWDEKYRSNRIRPETYINRYIDVKWQPLLQTPPFPEYTSGHSVVSTASATVLSYLLGQNFSFTDNTEEMFDISPRRFQSFMQAANEAAISRLYGGIHFRDAIENGQKEGRALGEKIVEKLKTAQLLPFNH